MGSILGHWSDLNPFDTLPGATSPPSIQGGPSHDWAWEIIESATDPWVQKFKEWDSSMKWDHGA